MKMQLAIVTVGLSMLSALGLFGCKKDGVNAESDAIGTTGVVITAPDAATLTQYALSSQTGGMTTMVTDVANLAYKRNNASYCGTSKDSTVTKSGASSNSNYSYTYSQTWSWLVSCSSAKVPASLTYKLTSTGQYKAPSATSTDQGQASMTVAGLQVSSNTYNLSGSYTRVGTESITAPSTTRTLSSTVAITATNVQVDKSSYKIQAGSTATAVISGKSSTGNSFSFNASIVFNGDSTATITINGKTYTVAI